MAYVLYEEGKRVGEVSDWKVAANEPVYKNVLGKTVLSVPANNECSFVSPKPIKRKSKLTILENGKTEIVLKTVSVRGATLVSAIIVSRKEI
ncbi:MAG: hypothetical protein ACXWC9_02335 [Pseudobdellovibrionaceae bacterium]